VQALLAENRLHLKFGAHEVGLHQRPRRRRGAHVLGHDAIEHGVVVEILKEHRHLHALGGEIAAGGDAVSVTMICLLIG
jgi:hypothetical protein